MLRPEGEAGYGRRSGTVGRAPSNTIIKVASGPTKTEIKNQAPPLRPFPWARPALTKHNVPQPTA